MFLAAIIIYIVIAITLGAYWADYCIWAVTGQDISFVADVALALIFSSVIIPASIFLWIAGLCGLVYPLIQAVS